MNPKGEKVFWEAMPADTRQVFEILVRLPVPEEFYLAGGTALALQIGHRISRDLDFFSTQNQLMGAERTALALQLQKVETAVIRREVDTQLYATIMGVEVSFIYQHHPLLFAPIELNNVRLAHPADIGLMKLAAVKDRGTRRDFVDLYCLRHIASFKELFKLLPQKYYDRPDFSVHLAYALSYFEDAESDPATLQMLQQVSWTSVKKYCTEGARLLTKLNTGLEPP